MNMIKKVLAVSVALGVLSGCATGTGEGDSGISNTAKYGAIGALAGAAAGALINHDSRGKGALIGAAAAGAAGAGYGYYADKQEAELRKSMASSGVQVERQGDNINLVMPGAITFATGSVILSADAQTVLSKLAVSLQQYPDTTIVVTGHTDSVGGLAANNQLSYDRASSVAGYLTRQGVPAARVQAAGAGPTQPVASNDTEQGRAQNRRVEIQLRAPAK